MMLPLLLPLFIIIAVAAQAQQIISFEAVDPHVLPLVALPAESVERIMVTSDDTIVVTRQATFRTRVLRNRNGAWEETFRYGSLDSNILFSGHQRIDEGAARFTCLLRNSMLTAAHGAYATLRVDRNGTAAIEIQADTFQTIRTGTSAICASASGHVMSARQRGGVQLPQPGSHLLYQFDPTGQHRNVGAIDAGTVEDYDGGFSIACYQDGSSLVSGLSTFTATEYSQAWLTRYDQSLERVANYTFLTDGSEKVLATMIESQPSSDTVLSVTVMRSSANDTVLVLSCIDRSGTVVRSEHLSVPRGSVFYPMLIRRQRNTWTVAGYMLSKRPDGTMSYAAFLRVRDSGQNIYCNGYVEQSIDRASFISYWTDSSGREYLGGYSSAGMIFYPISETVSSVHEPTSATISTVNLSQLLWGQAGGPSGCVHLYDLQGRHLGEVSSAAEILTKCAQNSLLWVVSDERSWLVTTQQHY